jgi:anaerobic selenocysteine-containing dehydrogenase
LPGENLWYASTCRQCAAGCGVIVRVSEGRARKVEGNPLHPLNRGKLCARGQAALQELYDPDRLKNAVRQVGGRGHHKFEPIYWDEAIQTLSAELGRAEPGAVAFLAGNPSTHLLAVAGRLLEALGSPPPLVYSLGDELHGRHALAQTSQRVFGEPTLPLFDVGQADVVFSFGANFLETWLSPVSYSRAYSQMRRGDLGKRGLLVQFEPRYSSTAASADEWVRLHPGTEGLVALAIGKIIVEEGLARAGGLEEFYARVEVDKMAEASGVPAERLEHLARVFASVSKPVAIPGGTPAAHQDGQTSLLAVQALNLLMQRLGQPGGVFLPPESAVEGLAPVGGFTDVRALVSAMKAGKVKVLLLHSANPVFELPAASGFAEALANVPLVVSFSPTVDETAILADLVLPDHTNLESWGYHVPPLADRTIVSGLQPTMRPLYDTRSTVDVLLAAAQELGGAASAALPWSNEVDFLQEVTGDWSDGEVSQDDFWAAWRQRGGWWAGGEEMRSPTLSAGLDKAASLNYPVFEGDSTNYPLNLHLYPSIALFDGRGANKSWLQETPDPMTTVAWQTWVELHPETAHGLELADEDVVRVISRAGEVQAIVYVYPGIEPGVAAMPVGQGHAEYGRYAQKRGSNPLDLLVPAADEASGALAWAATRVRIEKTGRKHSLARLEDPEGIDFLSGEGH